MADRVRPLKVENTTEGGQNDQGFQTDMNPMQDTVPMYKEMLLVDDEPNIDKITEIQQGVNVDGNHEINLFDRVTGITKLSQMVMQVFSNAASIASKVFKLNFREGISASYDSENNKVDVKMNVSGLTQEAPDQLNDYLLFLDDSANIHKKVLIKDMQITLKNYSTARSDNVSTNGGTYSVIPGMTVTPEPGKYAVWFSATVGNSNWNIGCDIAIGIDGVATSDSERFHDNPYSLPMCTMSEVIVDGTQEVHTLYKSRETWNDCQVGGRSLTLIKTGEYSEP